VPPLRACTVSLRDPEGVTHATTVHAETLFEAAAHALSAFRKEGWAAEGLTANAVLRVEVHLPAVVHDVPLRAVEQWPKGMTTKAKNGKEYPSILYRCPAKAKSLSSSRGSAGGNLTQRCCGGQIHSL
jgi:hypothetical protein